MQEEGVDNTIDIDPDDPKYYAKKAQQMKEQKALEETLPSSVQYKRWREQGLADKATKIQRIFRGYNDKENMKEGVAELSVPDESSSSSSSSNNKGTIQEAITVGKAKRKDKVAAYNNDQQQKEYDREYSKQRAQQVEDEGKLEKFMMKHSDLDGTKALQLFAKQTPNYQRYLSREEEEKLDEANKYDQLPAKRKLLRKLNNAEATQLDAQKMAKKTLTTNWRNWRFNKNEDGPNKEKLRIYQDLKREGKKEEAKEFAEHYILKKNPLRARAAPADDAYFVQGAEEHKEGIEEEEEEALPKRNLRSSKKANLKEQIESVENKTKARKQKQKQKTEPEPEFVDELEPTKEPDNLTPNEQQSVEKKYRKIDAEVQSLETKNKLVDSTVKQIKDLKKTNSKTSAPANLRKEIKAVYNQHGKNYNANTHLETIYKQLEKWKTANDEGLEHQLREKEKVVENVKKAYRKEETPKKNEKSKKEEVGGGGGGKVVDTK
jgi:hypothetical protein